MLRVICAKSAPPLRIVGQKIGSALRPEIHRVPRLTSFIGRCSKNRYLSTRGTTSGSSEQSKGSILAVGGAVFVGVAIAAYRSSKKDRPESDQHDAEYKNRLSTPTPKGSTSSSSNEAQDAANAGTDANVQVSSSDPLQELKPAKPALPKWLKSKYVIVGTGTAAFFAVRGILDSDPDAEVNAIAASCVIQALCIGSRCSQK